MIDTFIMDPLPIPEPPPIPPASPKKPFPVVGIFITILFLTLVGFLFYQQLQIRTLLTAKPSVTPTLAPTLPPDPTANWKTYTLTNNASFRYPDTFKVKTFDDTSLLFDTEDKIHQFRINTFTIPQDKTLYQFIYDGGVGLNYGKEYIDGNNITLTFKDVSQDSLHKIWDPSSWPSGNGTLIKFIQMNNQLIWFSMEPYNPGGTPIANEKQYEEIFNQILSTFEFTKTTSTIKTTPSIQISDNSSENMYISLPEGSQVAKNSITIENNIYILNTRIGPGLCNMGDARSVCGYIDKSTPIWKTFRIWDKQGKVFALNPQTGAINGKSAEGFILTKEAPNTTFSEEEINMWEKISDSLFVGN